MITPLWAYPIPGKNKCMRICSAFKNGCNGNLAGTSRRTLLPGAAFFYGWTDHTIPMIRECHSRGIEWYYGDNAYHFGYGVYIRVTRGKLVHDGSGNAGPERFKKFKLNIKPWRIDGRHIILTTQSEGYYNNHLGTTREAWTEKTIAELRKYTTREVRVFDKPTGRDLARNVNFHDLNISLRNAWALVAHSSATMVKALLDGVPVFPLGESMASNMGLADLSKIETPYMPDGREQWVWNLAANQWTMPEIYDGTCWRMLQEAK